MQKARQDTDPDLSPKDEHGQTVQAGAAAASVANGLASIDHVVSPEREPEHDTEPDLASQQASVSRAEALTRTDHIVQPEQEAEQDTEPDLVSDEQAEPVPDTTFAFAPPSEGGNSVKDDDEDDPLREQTPDGT